MSENIPNLPSYDERALDAAFATLADEVRSGSVDVDSAMERLRHMPFEDLGFAKVDHHRLLWMNWRRPRARHFASSTRFDLNVWYRWNRKSSA